MHSRYIITCVKELKYLARICTSLQGSIFHLQIYKWSFIMCAFFSSHHPLVRVLRLVGCVQQLAVLQLLTQPLQGVERLVELHWHGHLGQVLPDVVLQDVPQAHAASGTRGGQLGAPAIQVHPAADCRREMSKEKKKEDNERGRKMWDMTCGGA